FVDVNAIGAIEADFIKNDTRCANRSESLKGTWKNRNGYSIIEFDFVGANGINHLTENVRILKFAENITIEHSDGAQVLSDQNNVSTFTGRQVGFVVATDGLECGDVAGQPLRLAASTPTDKGSVGIIAWSRQRCHIQSELCNSCLLLIQRQP